MVSAANAVARRHRHSMDMPARKIAAAIGLDTNGQSAKASLIPMIAEAESRASSKDAGRTRKGIEKLTKAVCFNCGEFKLGAFRACSLCKRGPETDDQLVMSLALTDHYFDLQTLKVMGKDIKNGKVLQLDEQTRENLLSSLAKVKETTGIKFDRPAREPSSPPQKMQETPFRRKMSVILFVIALLTAIVLAGYATAYPYRSYDECVNEEIKLGGSAESSENFCWEERDKDNLREFGLNPLREDFLLYGLVKMIIPNSGDHFDLKTARPVEGDANAAVLNEAIETEGTANDSMTME